MVELGIVDIREIIRLVRKKYGFDFSNFALTSLKYRLEKIIGDTNLNSPEGLYRRLSDDPGFFEIFLSRIFVPSTEMFRDPSLWRWLRETYFPGIKEKNLLNFKIWIPYCVSGGELYSLAILLKELNLLDKIKIIASSFSERNLEIIKSGVYPLKKIDVSAENYKRFNGSSYFENYYTRQDFKAVRDISLIRNVEFRIDNINFENAPTNVRLILIRNVMIYFNVKHQDKTIKKMGEAISGSGNLILGLKEEINTNQNTRELFESINPNENVYRKKIG